jgi:hypothetical protein
MLICNKEGKMIISPCASSPCTSSLDVSVRQSPFHELEFQTTAQYLIFILKPPKMRIFATVIKALEEIAGPALSAYLEMAACSIQPIFCSLSVFNTTTALFGDVLMTFWLLVVNPKQQDRA